MGRKKTLREWGHAIPRFSIEAGLFSRRKTQGRVFGAGKSPCGKHADSHPGFGQGPVSNLTLKIKYQGVHQDVRVLTPPAQQLSTASVQPPTAGGDDWSSPGFEPGASGVRRPRARPLGNLTTVGHLAKVSLDLSTHFQTRKTSFSDT